VLRRQSVEERERPLREYWNRLTPEEQAIVEREALNRADAFRRKRYEESVRAGNQHSAEMYHEMILFEYIEREILKLIPSDAELAAMDS
jgi:hypothetical protein